MAHGSLMGQVHERGNASTAGLSTAPRRRLLACNSTSRMPMLQQYVLHPSSKECHHCLGALPGPMVQKLFIDSQLEHTVGVMHMHAPLQSCAEKLAGQGVDIMNAGVFVGGPDDPLKGEGAEGAGPCMPPGRCQTHAGGEACAGCYRQRLSLSRLPGMVAACQCTTLARAATRLSAFCRAIFSLYATSAPSACTWTALLRGVYQCSPAPPVWRSTRAVLDGCPPAAPWLQATPMSGTACSG